MTKTPEQLKQELRRQGKTAAQLARELGLNYPAVVRVMNGVNKGHHGEAHKIAVALGLKEPA